MRRCWLTVRPRAPPRPRWDDPGRALTDVPAQSLVQELEWCLRWIEEVDPSREQIETWMESREKAVQAGLQSEPDWEALFADRA